MFSISSTTIALTTTTITTIAQLANTFAKNAFNTYPRVISDSEQPSAYHKPLDQAAQRSGSIFNRTKP